MPTTTWTGESGNWTDPTWTDGVPNASLDAVADGTSLSPITLSFDTPNGAAHSLTMADATLAVTGGTLSLENSSSLDALAQSAGALDFLAGGTIGGPFSQTGGTLENDTGTLALDGSGTLSGTIGGAGEVLTDATTTLSGVTIANTATYRNNGDVAQTGLLTIGDAGGDTASVVNDGVWTLASTAADIVSGNGAGSSFTNASGGSFVDGVAGTVSVSGNFINDGLVENENSSGVLLFSGGTFTNAGEIAAQSGDIIFGAGEITTNLVGGTLTGGQWDAANGSAITITGDPITTDAATIDLGQGSEFGTSNGTTVTNIEQSLATIAAGGTFALQNSDYSTANAFTDAGVLDLTDGAEFSDSSVLRVAAGGVLSGGSQQLGLGSYVFGRIVNYGTIEAVQGMLGLGGPLIDYGTLDVESNATLLMGSGENMIAGRVTGGGTLLFNVGVTTIEPEATGNIRNVVVTELASLVLGRNVTLDNFAEERSGPDQHPTAIDLGGHTATLSSSLFSGPVVNPALVEGGGTLANAGTMTLHGAALDGGTELANRKTLTQTNVLALGDASGGTASVVNLATGTYTMTGTVGIKAASAAADTISNAGLFEVNATGTATIGAAFTNTGTIDVTSGTLEITAAFTNTGSIIGTETQVGGVTFITAPSAALFNQYAAATHDSGSAILASPPPPTPTMPTLAAPHAA